MIEPICVRFLTRHGLDPVEQIGIIALIAMTTFFRTTMGHGTEAEGAAYLGALFFGIVIVMFNGYAELSMTIFRLPVFYKQRDLLFYPAWAFALPSMVLSIPSSIVEAGIYTLITYYGMGFTPEASRYAHQSISLFYPPVCSLLLLLMLRLCCFGGCVQVLQVVSVTDVGAPDVECVVPIDSWDLSNHGHRQYWRNVCSSSVRVAGRIHHSQSENQTMVDLGVLVLAHHVRRDCNHCERVSSTSMGYSEYLYFIGFDMMAHPVSVYAFFVSMCIYERLVTIKLICRHTDSLHDLRE